MRFATLMLSALIFAAGTAAAPDDLTIVSKNTLNGKQAVMSNSYLAAITSAWRRTGPRHHHRPEDRRDDDAGWREEDVHTTTKQDMEQFAAKMRRR
jgi:hypothetical protein